MVLTDEAKLNILEQTLLEKDTKIFTKKVREGLDNQEIENEIVILKEKIQVKKDKEAAAQAEEEPITE
jgi:hypothetical protein